MADQTLRAYSLAQGFRSRADRRASDAAAGAVVHLAAIGLVAAATAGVFLGTGYFLLLQPRPEAHAAAPARGGPASATAAAMRPTEPGPAAAAPVPPAAVVTVTAAPARDTGAANPAAPQTGANPATPGVATGEPITALSPAEIAKLLREGEASFRTGDVDSARVFYRQAAAAGDAQAALRMGVTFDPAMLARGRLRNRYGDRTEARLWYLRAFDMGAADAPNRLAHLAREAAR